MPRFVLEVDASAVERAAGALDEATRDWRELLTGNIALLIQRIVDKTFEAQGRPGRRWKPLSPKYVAWKKRKGYGEHILKLRGHLRNSITAHATSPNTLEVGSNLLYARIHQFGGPIRRKTKRARLAERLLRAKGLKLSAGRAARLEKQAQERGKLISRMPARPYLPDQLTDQEKRGIAAALVHHLQITIEEAL